MPDSTTTTSELLTAIEDCLGDRDLDAARFLREGVREAMTLGDAWLTPEEEAFLESF
ncbi:MAG: hypothetical protein VX726_03400 [Planctomycetota bacterium]|nr:hypothetical protein [Planctomycetota bacterium]MEE2894765.1 hypothetical protein [Planctomycetota bacterium]